MKKLVLLFISLFLIYSQEARVNSFFEIYERSGPKVAAEKYFIGNKWADPKVLDNLNAEFDNILPQLGEYTGYKFIKKMEASKDYVVIHYLLKYERQPLLLVFSLYKPNKLWIGQALELRDLILED
jgi:hypothetical protein